MLYRSQTWISNESLENHHIIATPHLCNSPLCTHHNLQTPSPCKIIEVNKKKFWPSIKFYWGWQQECQYSNNVIYVPNLNFQREPREPSHHSNSTLVQFTITSNSLLCTHYHLQTPSPRKIIEVNKNKIIDLNKILLRLTIKMSM